MNSSHCFEVPWTDSAPVEAVAREVGYENTASFRRLFRRLAGMTPDDYRRKLQPPSLVARAAADAKPEGKPGSARRPRRAIRRAAPHTPSA